MDRHACTRGIVLLVQLNGYRSWVHTSNGSCSCTLRTPLYVLTGTEQLVSMRILYLILYRPSACSLLPHNYCTHISL